MKNIFILIFILVGCNTAIKKNVDSFNPNKINVSKSSNVSLLNRLRSNPGIYIEGVGVNAKVFTKGVSSINNQKEVLFILNGVQVGTFSQIVQTAESFILQSNLNEYLNCPRSLQIEKESGCFVENVENRSRRRYLRIRNPLVF